MIKTHNIAILLPGADEVRRLIADNSLFLLAVPNQEG